MCQDKFIAIAAACHAMRTSSGEPMPFKTFAKSSGVRGVGNISKRVKGFIISILQKSNIVLDRGFPPDPCLLCVYFGGCFGAQFAEITPEGCICFAHQFENLIKPIIVVLIDTIDNRPNF